MENMNSNTKLEVAVEIIAAKIAMVSTKGLKVDNEEIKQLIKEREKMYRGDKIVIDKIIREYGPEIKKNYNDV